MFRKFVRVLSLFQSSLLALAGCERTSLRRTSLSYSPYTSSSVLLVARALARPLASRIDHWNWLLFGLGAFQLSSCIVSDQLTTVTIAPDGAAHWVRYQSNVRSTEAGEKGAQELRQFAAAFEAREDDELKRFVAAGGEVVEARWLRRAEPFSTVVVGRLPGTRALEAFLTLVDGEGKTVVRTKFTRDGIRRRLTFTLELPRTPGRETAATPTLAEVRQAEANGISETRLAIEGGEIVAARGFKVSNDRRSALVEPREIDALVAGSTGPVELHLEWTVPPHG